MSNYTTIQGDTWDMVSLKNYGSERYVSTLINANLDHVGKVFFSAGVVLNIPAVATPTNSTLPPWRKNG